MKFENAVQKRRCTSCNSKKRSGNNVHESSKAGKKNFHKTNTNIVIEHIIFVIWILFLKVKWLDRTNDEIFKRNFISPWYRFGYESGSINGERPGELIIWIVEFFFTKKIIVWNIYFFPNVFLVLLCWS